MERNRRKNLILGRRPLDLFEFCELDAGAKVDLIQDGLKLGVEEAFAPLGDGKGQPVQCGAGNPTRQQSVPDFVQQTEQLFTMMDTARVAIGGVLNSLNRQDGIDSSNGTAAG